MMAYHGRSLLPYRRMKRFPADFPKQLFHHRSRFPQDIRQQTSCEEHDFPTGLNEALKSVDRLAFHPAIDGQRVVIIRRYGNISHRMYAK